MSTTGPVMAVWRRRSVATVAVLLGLMIAMPAAATLLPGLENPQWQVKQEVGGHRGLTHYQRHFTELFGGPQIVNILAVDLNSPDVRVQLTAADVWGLTRMPIPDMARSAGAMAAINGGFAPGRRHEEVGYGIMKFEGRVWPFVNDPAFHPAADSIGRNAVGIDAEGKWHFKSRGERGWEAGTRWDTDWPGMVDVMAAGSRLVQDGRVHPLVVRSTTRGVYLDDTRLHQRTFRRHPRTALGVTDQDVAVLVTIDGRHDGHAAGMTLEEVARFLVMIGVRDALELDGGGSTTMWLRNAPGNGVVNYPTDNKQFDHEGLRPLRLAVMVMARNAAGADAAATSAESAPFPLPSLDLDWEPMFQGVDHATFQLSVPRPIVGNVLRVDVQAPGISFFTTPPADDPDGEVRSQTASSFLREHDLNIAVNASTFGPVVQDQGVLQDINGLHVSDGRLVSEHAPGRPAVALTESNRPSFVESGGDFAHAHNAVAGYYTILHAGRILRDDPALDRPARGLHPRTAIGISRDERHLYLLTVDGRQPGYSEGVDLDLLAHLLRETGAWHGMNMDGGGSTVLAVRQPAGEPRILNRPIHRRQPGLERPNGNHLGIRALPLEP